MSAKTRQTDEKGKFVKLLARLGGLFAQTYILTESGKRDKEQVKLMLHALQLFKEDRLGWVAAGVKRLTQLSPADLLSTLSMRIEDLELSPTTKEFFAKQGILYLGEALSVGTGRGGRSLHTWNKAWRELNVWVTQVGIAWELDPWQVDWRPPYWPPDAALRARLERPTEESLNFPADNDISGWDDFFGFVPEPDRQESWMKEMRTQPLVEFCDFPGRCDDEHHRTLVQSRLKPDSGLHAGMTHFVAIYTAREEYARSRKVAS